MNRLVAVRGATCAKANTREEIIEKTTELLSRLFEKNDIDPVSIVSMFFTMTEDLNAEFPAVAAREMGFKNTALLCAKEVEVPGSLPRGIRVLIHYYSNLPESPKFVYLYEARELRSDLED